MLFTSNKYTNTYDRIISRSQSRQLTGYTEKHHIIPKCLGGSDEPDNLAVLTAREHFICHMLLVKMTSGSAKNKMRLALSKMLSSRSYQDRYRVTSHAYAYIRKQCSIATSGKNNPNFGKTHSAEVRKKMSDKCRAWNAKNPGKRAMSEETKRKLSIANTGNRHSEETKKRWSEIRKGRPGQVNNLGKRWWNDGIKSYLKYECPEGCVSGRLPLTHKVQ